uniref:Uncharacterized protein n=1 Tax=Leersia perrieri TaxID=77586 RepID=A0A0D9W2Z8_9ORYZ
MSTSPPQCRSTSPSHQRPATSNPPPCRSISLLRCQSISPPPSLIDLVIRASRRSTSLTHQRLGDPSRRRITSSFDPPSHQHLPPSRSLLRHRSEERQANSHIPVAISSNPWLLLSIHASLPFKPQPLSTEWKGCNGWTPASDPVEARASTTMKATTRAYRETELGGIKYPAKEPRVAIFLLMILDFGKGCK